MIRLFSSGHLAAQIKRWLHFLLPVRPLWSFPRSNLSISCSLTQTMNFEDYWYALEYKAVLISTNTSFLQPRPEIRYELSVQRWRNVDGFEWVMQKRCTLCEWTTGAAGYVPDRTGGRSLISTIALLLRLTAVKCFTGCSTSRLDWRSLKFNVFFSTHRNSA